MTALLLAAFLSAGPPVEVAGRTLDHYAAALSDETPTVRLRAVLSLRAFGADAVPVLIAALGHHDEAVRYWAASAVGDFAAADGAGDAVPALRTMLSGGRAERLAAAYALAKLGHPGDALPVLTAPLTDPQPRGAAGIAAADFLIRLGPLAAPAEAELKAALDSPNGYVKRLAPQALAALRGDE